MMAEVLPGSTWAAQAGRELLASQPARLRHVAAVAKRVSTIGGKLRLHAASRDRLLAAAFLHDVGYASELGTSGFHPLDGARFVARETGDIKLAALVAHHSCAMVEARLRGLDRELSVFPTLDLTLADALTHADMTVGPTGRDTTVHERLADVRRRYGDDHIVSRAVAEARPQLEAAVARTEARLRRAQQTQRRTARG